MLLLTLDVLLLADDVLRVTFDVLRVTFDVLLLADDVRETEDDLDTLDVLDELLMLSFRPVVLTTLELPLLGTAEVLDSPVPVFPLCP